MYSRYRGKSLCKECSGHRIRKDAFNVKVQDTPIVDLLSMSIWQLIDFIGNLKLNATDSEISKRITFEIEYRLGFMNDVGLGYLSLNRLANSLSGGECQRINLTRTLGSNLTDSLYILDEPSIGLHPRDTKRLITVLRKLRDLNNTVVIVEHEEDIIRASDYIIDIGPKAGVHGGHVVYQGDFVADKPEGKGQMSWPDGSVYEGEFLRGKLHGKGKLTRRNGVVQEGKWNNDQFVEP